MSLPVKSQWFAKLDLDFDYANNGTRLKSVKRFGPLSVQKAFHPEGKKCAHIYLLHPPAGIVSGDELCVTVRVDNNAHVLITTPGANRFYRARDNLSIGDPTQIQIADLYLSENAILEHFPLETLVYEGADGVNRVDVHLTEKGVYLGWDIVCLGLPASKQNFVNGRFTQLNRLFCDDKLIYHDRISLNPENGLLSHPAGLAGHSVFGSFIIYAPKQHRTMLLRRELVEKIQARVSDLNAALFISITDINGLLLIRYLGDHSEQCKNFFIEIWQLARPSCCGKSVTHPRIWLT